MMDETVPPDPKESKGRVRYSIGWATRAGNLPGTCLFRIPTVLALVSIGCIVDWRSSNGQPADRGGADARRDC
jgi:hypothetical protein